MSKVKFWKTTLAAVVLGAMLLPGLAFASNDDRVDVLIAVKKPYDSVIDKIEALDGTVRMEYKHIDAVAATVPRDQIETLQSMPEVTAFRKDQVRYLDSPRKDLDGGASYGNPSFNYEISASEVSGDLAEYVGGAAPEGYFPTEVDLMGASDFWNQTGHFGEDVIIGIMDTGTAEVSSISGRVIGGENFTGDGVGATSSANHPHGTWVATTAGANIIFGFFAGSFTAAVERYLPEAILPDFFAPGIHGIPMVGPAPSAEFYAFKIFNVNSATSNSIILAAFDRAIELKTLYDAGDPSGVNIQVLNGSFSGGTLYSGKDPFFGGMISEVTKAGIVTVFSASNDGPGTMTGGDPGTAKNTITSGATSPAEYEQILRDLQFGPGFGELWRATDAHQTAEFSSRGPTADGRWDPDIAAPGASIFAQGPTGSLNFVSGTSFSAPNTAGAAALLLSAKPHAKPLEIRGALLNGADRYALDDNSKREDMGRGFVDMIGALNASKKNPSDKGKSNKSVKKNVEALGFDVYDDASFSHTTDWLLPGEGHEIFVEIEHPIQSVSISFSVEQENAPADQNVLFGDRALFTVTSSKTHFGEYLFFGLSNGASFTIPEEDLDFGLLRITPSGDDDNAGRIRITVNVNQDKTSPVAETIGGGDVAEGELDVWELDVPAGLSNLDFYLTWDSHWGNWPTNDLDIILIDPNGNFNFDGAGLGSPERSSISSPVAGTWTILVNGFTVWNGAAEKYKIRSNVFITAKTKAEAITDVLSNLPKEFTVAQNYPNPFNPTTNIKYALPEAGNVKVEIFDIRGVKVRTLLDEQRPAGFHEITWNARNDAGLQAASGVYFYRVIANSNIIQKRMLLVK